MLGPDRERATIAGNGDGGDDCSNGSTMDPSRAACTIIASALSSVVGRACRRRARDDFSSKNLFVKIEKRAIDVPQQRTRKSEKECERRESRGEKKIKSKKKTREKKKSQERESYERAFVEGRSLFLSLFLSLSLPDIPCTPLTERSSLLQCLSEPRRTAKKACAATGEGKRRRRKEK